jgi:Cu/Ag efflux pump CusA
MKRSDVYLQLAVLMLIDAGVWANGTTTFGLAIAIGSLVGAAVLMAAAALAARAEV